MQPSWTAPFSLPLLQRLSCLEGILSCPCRFLYPADSIGSLQGGFLRRLLRCPSFHLLLHPGCQALELATRSFCSGWMLIFTDGGAVLIVRRCMVFGSNRFRGFSLIRDGFRLFLADGILPCGISGLAFLVLSFDGKRSTFRHFLSILDSWCLPGSPDLLLFCFDGI